MKKILFATTALVATASVAAADVTFSGYGRFGVMTTTTNATAAVAAEIKAAEKTTLDAAHKTQLDTLNLTTVDSGSVVADDGSVSAEAIDASEMNLLNDARKAQAALLATANQLADTTGADTATKNIAAIDAVIAAASGTAAVAKKTTTDITNRMEINVAASFEASNGITYGGKMRVRSDGGNAHFNAPQFSAAMGGVSVAVGNNSGQMYKAAVNGSDVGLTSLGFRTYVVSGFDEYSSYGAGNQGVDLNYTSAGFSAGVSHSKTTKNTQVGVSYSVGALSLGAVMQDGTLKASDMNAVSVGYALGGGNIDIAYGTNDGTKKTRVGGSFDVGAATSMTAFVLDTNEAGVKNTYGLGVSHDLGGASLKAGYVKHDTGSAADFGIVFNF